MYLKNVCSRVTSAVSVFAAFCLMACGGEYTGYKVILPDTSTDSMVDMSVPVASDMASVTPPAAAFDFEFECLASPTCGFKFFYRTPQKTGTFDQKTVPRGKTWQKSLPLDNVCDRQIVDPAGFKINGNRTGTFTRGLEVTVVNSAGEYYNEWSGDGHASCDAAFRLYERVFETNAQGVKAEHRVLIPVVTIQKSDGSFNCLISEDFLHGTPDESKCVYLK